MRQLDSMTEGRGFDFLFVRAPTFTFIIYRGRSGQSSFQCWVRLAPARRYMSLHSKRANEVGARTFGRKLSRGVALHREWSNNRRASFFYPVNLLTYPEYFIGQGTGWLFSWTSRNRDLEINLTYLRLYIQIQIYSFFASLCLPISHRSRPNMTKYSLEQRNSSVLGQQMSLLSPIICDNGTGYSKIGYEISRMQQQLYVWLLP